MINELPGRDNLPPGVSLDRDIEHKHLCEACKDVLIPVSDDLCNDCQRELDDLDEDEL